MKTKQARQAWAKAVAVFGMAMGTLLGIPGNHAANAQSCNATGTCGNVSATRMTGNFVVPLANQELQTLTVGPQGPAGPQGAQGPQGATGQSALANSFYANGYAQGAPHATAYANCGAARVVSGGGSCLNLVDFSASMGHSNASGNGWSVGCSSSSGMLVGVQAYALCAPN